jgi:hypothetical protein
MRICHVIDKYNAEIKFNYLKIGKLSSYEHFQFRYYKQLIINKLYLNSSFMQFIHSVLFYFCVSFLACQTKSQEFVKQAKITAPQVALKAEHPTNDGFAVVELFTSEGCSSCPPAEKLANEIAKDADENTKNIFVLAFHVDYWNRLGWQDRFSAPEFSKRQYWYAKNLVNNSVYTPQMIVNGQQVFVGSNRNSAHTAIQKALANLQQNSVTIKLKSANTHHLAYELSQIPQNLSLNIALLEKHLSSNVTAGENEGKKLYHYSVVSQFKTLDNPTQKGVFAIPTQKESKPKSQSLIVFLQHTQTLEIVGVGKWDF